jgi:hypothetical protein
MTGKAVNLRLERKRKGRAAARDKADANAARHGEAKAGRSLREARAELEARRLEGHRREDSDDGDTSSNVPGLTRDLDE